MVFCSQETPEESILNHIDYPLAMATGCWREVGGEVWDVIEQFKACGILNQKCSPPQSWNESPAKFIKNMSFKMTCD